MRSHAYSLLKSIFRTAVARRFVRESPVAVEGAAARVSAEDITLLTVAQVQALADAMPARHRLLVLLAAWCGLRFGELTGLRRRDINLDQETISIEQAAVTVAGARMITTPKSAAGHAPSTCPHTSSPTSAATWRPTRPTRPTLSCSPDPSSSTFG